MTRADIELILASAMPLEEDQLDTPSNADWENLEAKFHCKFGSDFVMFYNLMNRYQFPGDLLNVASGKTNGNDTVAAAYDLEVGEGIWNREMIPFFSIGNGDYFCLNRNECPDSPIYYFYADRQEYGRYNSSFHEWVKQLPEFLA